MELLVFQCEHRESTVHSGDVRGSDCRGTNAAFRFLSFFFFKDVIITENNSHTVFNKMSLVGLLKDCDYCLMLKHLSHFN